MTNFSEMRDRLASLPALERKMASLDASLQSAETKIRELTAAYIREARDVEDFQKSTLSAFVQKLFGKYEERLNKEQREALDAKLAYDRAVTRADDLRHEKRALGERISELRRECVVFEGELDRRRALLSNAAPTSESLRYQALERERLVAASQLAEVKEARNAASKVKATSGKALKSLSSAENWATFDIWTRGGLLTHAAKYSHIDDAEACFYALSSQMKSLRAELGDVRGLTTPGLPGISESQRAVDFWFDNIFTDLSVRDHIKENMVRLNKLIDDIQAVEVSLGEKHASLCALIDEIDKEQEQLLLS